jgi:hypothetical protein
MKSSIDVSATAVRSLSAGYTIKRCTRLGGVEGARRQCPPAANPTLPMLETIARALDVGFVELFAAPAMQRRAKEK